MSKKMSKRLLIVLAVAMAIITGAVEAAIPVPTGTNPATGNAWAIGDHYRLVFITSTNGTWDADKQDYSGPGSPEGWTIADFNGHVQGLADAAGMGEANWFVIGSTADIDARDNTNTNPTVADDNDGNGVGVPILLVDGTTVVSIDNADLWDGEVQNTISKDENGIAKDSWPFTGTGRDGTAATANFGPLGQVGGNVNQGQSSVTTNWIHRAWTGDPPATALPLYAMSEVLFFGTPVKNVSPVDKDENVEPSSELPLRWTNMDPNAPATSVFVDVWFGTDPNKLKPLVYSRDGRTGIDVTGDVISSVLVDASVEQTYYWQVDSYINGSATGDPIEGPVWSFTVVSDVPPVNVVMGDDMMTWSAKPVPMVAPTFDDDNKSTVTYLWTADAASVADSDLVIDISDPAAANPTVTITDNKADRGMVTVTLTVVVSDEYNAGNENPASGSLTIDIYDDACHMAHDGEGKSAQTDFNGDCITNLEDFAKMVAAWLDDYKSSGPLPKPE